MDSNKMKNTLLPLPKEWENKLFAVLLPTSFGERDNAEQNIFGAFASKQAACEVLAPLSDREEPCDDEIVFVPIRDFLRKLAETPEDDSFELSINHWLGFVFINPDNEKYPFNGVRLKNSVSGNSWQHSLACLQDDWNNSDDCFQPLAGWCGKEDLKFAELFVY